MAKIYTDNDIFWSDEEIYAPLEDAYWELSEMLALKRLDGHNPYDQWYMAVHRKLGELLDVLDENPEKDIAEEE